jgi:HAMP domain-containing protein
MKAEIRDAAIALVASALDAAERLEAMSDDRELLTLRVMLDELDELSSTLERMAEKLQRLIDCSDYEEYLAAHPVTASRTGGAA